MAWKNKKHKNNEHLSQSTVPATTATPSKGWSYGYDWKAAVGPKCTHDAAKPVIIGGKEVWLGSSYHITPDTVRKMDYVCPLNGSMPDLDLGQWAIVIGSEMKDRGPVPAGWDAYIKWIVGMVQEGKKIVAFCTGSHGRTGTFGASLIALMEPETEDPIAAIRERHCPQSVECREQAEAIFALRGKGLPEKYQKEFKKFEFSSAAGVGYASGQPTSTASLPQITDPETRKLLHDAFNQIVIDGWGSPFEKVDGNGQKYIEIRIYRDWHDSSKDVVTKLSDVPAVLAAFRAEKAAKSKLVAISAPSVESAEGGIIDLW